MQAYILDVGILSRYSEIVGKGAPDVQLITHASAVAELETLGKKGAIQPELVELVQKSADAGSISIDRTDFSYLQASGASAGATGADDSTLLVELSKLKAQVYTSVAIVTDNIRLTNMAAGSAVGTIGFKDFLRVLTSPSAASINPEIAKLIDELAVTQRKESRRFVMNLGAAALFVGILYRVLPEIVAKVIPQIGPIVATVSVVLLGVALFLARSRARLAYGIAEFGVGCLLGFQVYRESSLARSTGNPLSLSTILQFLASLYVVVRGMDNIGKSPQKAKRFPWWNKLFPE